jgi:uncharacterized damage-inducible protein DinB
MTSLSSHLVQMAAYNAWANQRLIATIETLPESCLWEDRQAFFGSIMGTLNHLLVCDRLWIARMANQPYDWFTGLDQILERDLTLYKEARYACDQHIIATVPTLPTEGSLAYTDSQGNPQNRPWSCVLPHLFNHQTHHRAQAHTLVSQCGTTPPPLDFLYFIIETNP